MKRFESIMEYTFDPYSGGVSRDRLVKELRILSKRANQRLVRLERARSEISGSAYSEFGAYKVYAEPALDGRKRFKESGYNNIMYKDLQKKIVELQRFLGAKTSTVTGQREAEEKRQKTFESGKWGSARLTEGAENRHIKSADTNSFYDFLNSKLFKDLRSLGFSSEKIIEIYDEMSENVDDEEIVDRLNKAYEQFLDEEEAGYNDFLDFLKIPEL